jgi:Phage tail protein (Tail_P2_I)
MPSLSFTFTTPPSSNPVVVAPVAALTIYKDMQRDLAPPWLLTGTGIGWLETFGSFKDVVLERYVEAIRKRFLLTTEESCVALLGADRSLERYPFEPLDKYRARVADAWNFWEFAGTLDGLTKALKVAGWSSSIVELWRTDPLRWCEFDVYVWPTVPLPNPVTDVWDDTSNFTDNGTFWDQENINSIDIGGVRSLIFKLKPAHTRLSQLLYAPAVNDIWDDENFTDDGSVWNDIEFYPS